MLRLIEWKNQNAFSPNNVQFHKIMSEISFESLMSKMNGLGSNWTIQNIGNGRSQPQKMGCSKAQNQFDIFGPSTFTLLKILVLPHGPL